MNLILKALYRFFKTLAQIGMKIFYPNTIVLQRERLRFDHPSIVVSNHPNTMLDVFNVASRVKKQVFFLANSSLFKTPFQSWFFNTFYCIPIQRPQDTNGRKIDNEKAFEQCDIFLGDGGCLYIAPEGSSFMERRLRPLKTGTMRIGFSAESKKDFQLGLKVVPVGLTYEAPNHFRTGLVINVGEPINLADYADDYKKDSFKTSKTLTKQLDAQMRDLIIDTVDDDEDRLLRQIEVLLAQSKPLAPKEHFFRTKTLLEQLRRWKTAASEEYAKFRQLAQRYSGVLIEHKLFDITLFYKKNIRLFLLRGLFLLAGFPVYLWGALNNYLPFMIPGWINKKLKLYIGYASTVKFIGGLVMFPLFYFIQYKLASSLLPAPWPWIYLLSLPLAGLFALGYLDFFKQFRAYFRQRKFEKQYPELMKQLKAQRQELLNRIEMLLNAKSS